MKKATDALISDHKMIRKLLTGFDIDNPKLMEISKTLERVVLTHAWFEDSVFLPALKNNSVFSNVYLNNISDEHKDIDALIKLIRKTNPNSPKELSAAIKQFSAVLENHLQKEEDALFPLAERALDEKGMNQLSQQMQLRQSEAQKLFNS